MKWILQLQTTKKIHDLVEFKRYLFSKPFQKPASLLRSFSKEKPLKNISTQCQEDPLATALSFKSEPLRPTCTQWR